MVRPTFQGRKPTKEPLPLTKDCFGTVRTFSEDSRFSILKLKKFFSTLQNKLKIQTNPYQLHHSDRDWYENIKSQRKIALEK